MDTATKPLEELIRELPPSLQAEVRDFIEFLLTRHNPLPGNRLRQDWAGALKEHKQQYTSVDLQHQATRWRDE